MYYFRGKRYSWFEGFYLKHQNETQTVALIPAYHADRDGRRSASLQVITDGGAFNVRFPICQFAAAEEGFLVRLGNSLFCEKGCKLEYQSPDLELSGMVRYGPLTRLESDIMGPFRFAPMMQCRHSVFSMRHSVDGYLTINGQEYQFNGGEGYLEGDRGSSFPERYLWTQCFHEGSSVFLSVADVPFLGGDFTGCIGIVHFNNEEYRFATYSGAKILLAEPGLIMVRQDDMTLTVRLLDNRFQTLHAPVQGQMSRMIRENPACRVWYRFRKGGRTLLEFECPRASYEEEFTPASQPDIED